MNVLQEVVRASNRIVNVYKSSIFSRFKKRVDVFFYLYFYSSQKKTVLFFMEIVAKRIKYDNMRMRTQISFLGGYK